MRIAFFAWEALHAVPVGAAAVYAFRLPAALARRGHDVHLFTRLGAGQRFSDRIEGVGYHRIPVARCDAFLDEIRGMAVPFLHYYRAETARGGPFDRIHAVDWLAIPAAFAALDDPEGVNARRPPPLAVAFHGTEWGRSGVWPDQGISGEIADLERAASARADAIAAVTGKVRRELDSLYRPPDWKTDTIRHGIDPAPFDAGGFDAAEVKARGGWPVHAPIALYAGRLERARGAELLVDAWLAYRQAAARRPASPSDAAPFRLVMAGDGRDAGEIAARAAAAGPGESAFPGPLSGGALADWYRAADVVLSPSDAFASGALSAWAARKPVIAGTASGSAEVILDGVTGWLAPPNPEAWAEALRRAGENPDRLRWMGANGREALTAAFTWDAVAERTLALYDRDRRLADHMRGSRWT